MGAAGSVIAESQTVQEMVRWTFQVLLAELSCSLEYVSVTVFTLKTTPLSGNISLADFARQSCGEGRQELQGSVPQGLKQKSPPIQSSARLKPQQMPRAASNPCAGTGIACGSQPAQCSVVVPPQPHACAKFSAKCPDASGSNMGWSGNKNALSPMHKAKLWHPSWRGRTTLVAHGA